jgi:hypothetical protein
MKYLADASENWTQITSLDLNGNNIGDEGMKYLADASKNWTQITRLGL